MPDGHYDAVTTVYTLRNFPSLEDALREMLRVLRPGGAGEEARASLNACSRCCQHTHTPVILH